MTSSWRALLCVAIFLGGCNLNALGEHGEALSVNICPADGEREVRVTFDLENGGEVQVSTLLERASSSGFIVEETMLSLRNTQCLERPDNESMTIYVIHAGFDPTNSYTRHFVVLPNENGAVSAIEVQRAYPAR